MKSNIIDLFSGDSENYLKIKVANKGGSKDINELAEILTELKIQNYLESEPEILSTKYSNWVGRHEFYKSKYYALHIIYEREYLYLILKCSLKKRQVALRIIKRHFK